MLELWWAVFLLFFFNIGMSWTCWIPFPIIYIYIYSILTFHMLFTRINKWFCTFTIPNGSRHQITKYQQWKENLKSKWQTLTVIIMGQIANMQTIRVSQTVEYNVLILDILTVRAWERHSLPFCSVRRVPEFSSHFMNNAFGELHANAHTQPWTNHNILCYRRKKKLCL